MGVLASRRNFLIIRRMRVPVLVPALVIGVAAATGTSQRVVFGRVFPNAGQIRLFVAAADGSGERPLLASTGMDYDPVWSPDGKSIAFTSERGGSADLYLVRPDGTGLDRLTDDPAYDDQAAFSPDGKRIVFVSSRESGFAHLVVIDLGTRRTAALTSDRRGDFRPAWSHDGNWIAFSSADGNQAPFAHGRWERLQLADLYIIHPDGSGLKRITDTHNFCGSPKWELDNVHVVAYCAAAEQTLAIRRPALETDEDTRIVAVDVNTGVLDELVMGSGAKFSPSPVAAHGFGYIRKNGSGKAAGIYYSDGTDGPRGDIRAASWSPDGRSVVFHKRLAAPIPVFQEAFSRNPEYELTLTGTFLPSFARSGGRFVTNSRPTPQQPLGSSILLTTARDQQSQVIYHDAIRNVLAPQWSPHEDRVIFGVGTFNAFFNGFHGLFLAPEDRVEGGAQVALVNADGSGFREVTTGANNNAFPSFAPDGRRFVFRTFGPEGIGLRIMDLESKRITPLTREYDNFPLWSPRGDLILFSRQAEGAFEIYTIKPDGTALKRLTFTHGNDAHMAWSPDGKHIAFTSSRMGFKDEVVYTDSPQPYGEIFVMRYDGSDIQQLTDNQWEDGAPAWWPVANSQITRDGSKTSSRFR
jgi:Tol biopolymer transport system component